MAVTVLRNNPEPEEGLKIYSQQEMMVVAASRLLRNNEKVLVGTGIPLVGAILAKNTHAPEIVILMEAVAFDSDPQALPFCVADPRAVYKTRWVPTAVEVMGQFLQSGDVDTGFLGGSQVDRYGNLNSTFVGGDYFSPHKRFEGSGGACDIAALSGRTIIIIAHEKRRFVETVDYITSPGWKCRDLTGKNMVDRESIGLRGGPYAVVSTLGVMKFDPQTHEMYVDGYYADLGVSLEQIKEETAFDIDVSRANPVSSPLTQELNALRSKVDPEGIYMKY